MTGRTGALAAWTPTPQAVGEEGTKMINSLICELHDELKFGSSILETEDVTFTSDLCCCYIVIKKGGFIMCYLIIVNHSFCYSFGGDSKSDSLGCYHKVSLTGRVHHPLCYDLYHPWPNNYFLLFGQDNNLQRISLISQIH